MNKENYTNIIDFGSNKIRISVFDNELNEKFFETCKVLIDENFSNHLDVVTKIIKSAEKKNFISYSRYYFNFRFKRFIYY